MADVPTERPIPASGRPTGRLIVLSVLTGVGAGIGGIVLTELLHLVQHLAFGYTEDTFLEGVQRASGARRVLALSLGGLLVGLGWWALRRWLRPVVQVADVVAEPSRRFHPASVAGDAVLQIIAVGFGASLGREGAPRQIGGLAAGWLSSRAGLDAVGRRTLVACGAGAGLAAVYNVPLGGALFTLEVLLVSAAMRDVIPAVVSAATATVVVWPVLSNRPIYTVPIYQPSWSATVAAVLLGPVAGVVGAGFVALMTVARSRPPTGWRLPIAITVVFAALGAAAVAFPELLGNGRGPAQLAFVAGLAAPLLLVLVVLKPLATAACLASGATGGLLTPALATGALLGALAGTGWSAWWPGTPVSSFALMGAAAVLAATQRAPLCALVLVLELTNSPVTLLVPMMIAVAGSMVTARVVSRKLPHGTGRVVTSPDDSGMR